MKCFRCWKDDRVAGAYCRPCATILMRKWRKTNPERNRAIGKRSDKKRYSDNVAKFSQKRSERHVRWKEAHPLEYRKQCNEKYHRTRRRALDRLGGICTCCGEARFTMLEIDHIHNDGHLEGRERRAYTLARKVLRAVYPQDRYQVMCSNCNHSKARNGGTCEHKTEKPNLLTGVINEN